MKRSTIAYWAAAGVFGVAYWAGVSLRSDAWFLGLAAVGMCVVFVGDGFRRGEWRP